MDFIWSITSILGNIEVWYHNSGVSSHLPLFLIWNIWITRNLSLFEGRNIGIEHTYAKILDQTISYPLIMKMKRKRARLVGSLLDLQYPHRFFDEASKNNKLVVLESCLKSARYTLSVWNWDVVFVDVYVTSECSIHFYFLCIVTRCLLQDVFVMYLIHVMPRCSNREDL